MSLFQLRPSTGEAHNYYTVGLNSTWLLVGLGNPGKEYDLTRHNVGFECLDAYVSGKSEFDPWMLKKDLKCHVTSGRLGETRVIAIKPTTFMNLSGEAVQAAAAFYKMSSDHIVVLHDELDVNFGQIRTRNEGSAAGHNGLKSIISKLGQDFGRIRIGVGPKKPEQMETSDYVLQKFSKSEQGYLANMQREVSVLLDEIVYGGQLPHDTRSFLI